MPSHDDPPCFSAPGIIGPKYANPIKIKPIIGSVGPTLRLAASRVRMSKAEPMKTSNCDGLPTRWAKADAGNNGKYIAAVTAKNAKIISINGIPSSLYQALGDNVSLVFCAPNNKNTSPKTNDKWMPR